MPKYVPQIVIMSEAGLLESEWVEKQLGRPVVKAFNSITHNSLEHLGKPVGSSDRIALPLAGDRVEDKKKVAKLIADLGFDALDSGPLSESWRQQPGVVGLFTTFSDDTLDVERFALVRSLKPLTCEGNFSRLRAKPAHFVGHLPRITGAPQALAALNGGVLALMDWLNVPNVTSHMRHFCAHPGEAFYLLRHRLLR